ncbi:MAG: GAF domain-containing sensor histidine kinase [Pseudonocardia sp.]|nr:GAF domain-containing sensor histidine kinase [Pseudonocardia sp.]MBO0871859.1 GAF domain-containing sensor histidine kinase [Pseudonocardia sp.]
MAPGLVRGLVDRDGEVALLLDVIHLTATGPEVEPLAAEVARLITDATATDVCFVHVLDDTEHSLTLAGATPPFDAQAGRIHLPLGVGVSGWVAKHGTPVVLPEAKASDPRYVAIPELRGTDFTSMASIPMEIDPGGLVGVLNVHTVQRREFTPRDVELLRVIGRLVAGALNQARLHRRLAARERMHEQFAERVIATQEAVHRRMAGDIHDGISQRLISLSYYLDAASHAVDDPAEVATQLTQARELLGLALDEARTAISGLRPPVLDDLGLAGGLASLARATPQIETEVELVEHRLPEHVEIALYRIAQECLQNIVKHSRASSATLRLDVRDGEARLEVSDDGVGFETLANAESDHAGARGYGMQSMVERAELVGGRLWVRSRPGEGTTVTVTVPAR